MELPGIEHCELYPNPIPDLFSGSPLLIAGKFKGEFPPEIKLHGNWADSGEGETTVYVIDL